MKTNQISSHSPKVAKLTPKLSKSGERVSGGPESLTAVYPDAISAARIEGVSRQAINQAISNGTLVNGSRFMKYYDWLHREDSK